MVFQEILDRQGWHGQFIKEKHYYIVNVLVVYPKFKHFQQKILPLKMNGWSQKEDTDSIVFKFFSHLIPTKALPVGHQLCTTFGEDKKYLPFQSWKW